ncbi:acyl-CoA N-acyltransferase [Xylaria flabelliformis]|nr:acyl-CoA N-acyltransferase [Xylaria flabelliformis]
MFLHKFPPLPPGFLILGDNIARNFLHRPRTLECAVSQSHVILRPELLIVTSIFCHKMSSLNPHLRTENLLLRPAVPSDAAVLAAIFANRFNTQHEPHKPSNPTEEEYQRRIAKWDDLRALGKAYFLVISRRATTETGSASPSAGSVIGFGGINAISTDAQGKRVADLGVLIDSSEWRKGYGREALQATLDFAFRKVEAEGAGCEEAFFETLAVNTPFQALADRMGLVKWRQVKSEGKEVEYRFSKEDWEGIKNGTA